MDKWYVGDDNQLDVFTYSFGYLLKRLRKARDLTQEELAKEVGCVANTIHKIENDARHPSRLLAERLANVFRLTEDERTTFIKAARSKGPSDRIPLPQRPIPEAITRNASAPSPAEKERNIMHNLAFQMTPFIGREQELHTVSTLITELSARVIVIYGLGGVGKTRLAIAAGERQLALTNEGSAPFCDGIFFVALSGITSHSQLTAAIASSLHIPLDSKTQPMRRQLIDYIRRKCLLLILDNYDQLSHTIDLINDIMAASPRITIIITSRHRLGFYGEHLMLLEGLPIPSEEDDVHNPQCDSVSLFLTAARRVRPTFEPDLKDMQAISMVCRLTEGMPLAIELAAAWISVLPPVDLLAELQQSIHLLITDMHSVPYQQRSIRAVCEAAWQHLDGDEQQIFARLCVFRGGCTREAAEAIAGANLHHLVKLVRHALVKHDLQHDRYIIHELLRHYGMERLTSDPDHHTAIVKQHATYYCSLLVHHIADLRGPEQMAAIAALTAEDKNIHLAWQYVVTDSSVKGVQHVVESVGVYYEWQGRLQEGQEAFRIARTSDLRLDNAEQVQLLAGLLAWHGTFCTQLSQFVEAEESLQRSLALVENEALCGSDIRALRAFVLWRLGQLRMAQHTNEAYSLYSQSLNLYTLVQREWEISTVLADRGELFRLQGRLPEADQSLSESQARCERNGDWRGLIQALQLRSQVCLESGHLHQAENLARQCKKLCEKVNHPVRRAEVLPDLA